MAARMTLHAGDVVVFEARDGTLTKGSLALRPYGRRLWAAVRAEDQRLHVVPKQAIVAVEAPAR